MRKILLVLSIILVIAAGVYLYLRYNKLRDFEPELKTKLDKLVQEASHGLYHLEMEKLETDPLKGKIVLTNVHLFPDTLVYARMEQEQKAPNDLFDITIHQLNIDDVDPAGFLANKELYLRRLFVGQPAITVWHKKQPYLLAEDSSRTIFQLIQKDLKNVKVDSIIVNDIDLLYHNVNKKKTERILNVRLFMEDFLIDSTTQFDRQRFLFSKNCLISLKDYSHNTPDSLYRLTAGLLEVATNKGEIEVTNLAFSPRVSAARFYEVLKHQQDRFELHIPKATLENVNWWAFLAEENFLANNIRLENGKIQVFNDRSLPPDTRSKIGKYPQQLLMKIPFDIKLDSIHIRNFDVTYREHNPQTDMTGMISFSDVNGTVINVTNMNAVVKAAPVCTIRASGKFMNEAAMKATFKLDLAKAANGNFSVSASMDGIKGETLNRITRPLALVEIRSVQVKGVNLEMHGNNYEGAGTVKLLYNDLAISALKKDDDTLKKRGLLSFIANNFVIKTANPSKNQPARVEKGAYQRDTTKSFFNLIWKTIFTGVGETVGFKAK